MKKLVSALLISVLATSPALAKSNDAHRAECIFSFGIDQKSCRIGFNSKEYKKLMLKIGEVLHITLKRWESGEAIHRLWKRSPVHGSRITDLALTIVPTEFRFMFRVGGSGFSIIYDTRDKIKRAIDYVDKYGAPDISMMWEILPDELRIIAGGEFALFTTIEASVWIAYDSEKDIRRVADIIKCYYKGTKEGQCDYNHITENEDDRRL